MSHNINRRDFLKRAIAGGVVLAASSLPVVAVDEPEKFPKRGQYERLLLSYSTVHIGLPKPFSVLHISDTHLTAVYPHESERMQARHRSRTATFGGRQEEALRDSLDWAREHVDYIVYTGDLIDWQTEANYDLVRKYFGDKMFGTIGNHEYWSPEWLADPSVQDTVDFRESNLRALGEVYPFDVSFHAQQINGVNFIGIDDAFGTVTESQVERFKDEAAKGLPMVLCMHVPFYSDEIWRASERFWNDGRYVTEADERTGEYRRQLDDPVTRDFISYLRQEPLLRAILTGHEHFALDDRFSPTAMQYVAGGNFLFHGREVMFV